MEMAFPILASGAPCLTIGDAMPVELGLISSSSSQCDANVCVSPSSPRVYPRWSSVSVRDITSFQDHYEQVASGYNKCYAGTHTATMKVVMEQMMLTQDDMVVDIGGGTGYIAHQMWKQATLKHPVLCVEPSAAMLQATKNQHGVVPVQATAEEFFSNPRRYHFNKVLMCACVHHFKDPGTAFSGLSGYLPKSGFCVIITRPPATSLPFFTAALVAFANSCANVKSLINILHSQELTTKVTTEVMRFEVKKHEWYKMLQDRYMSHLEQFTDDEIKSGISELEHERFCGIQEHDLIQLYDPVTIIKVWNK